jgi:DNA-binding ferritin-like protein
LKTLLGKYSIIAREQAKKKIKYKKYHWENIIGKYLKEKISFRKYHWEISGSLFQMFPGGKNPLWEVKC